MSNVFCGWRLQTLIHDWWLNYWRHSASTLPKNLFLMCFYFWCVLLICKLWRRELGELVFEMERNFSYLMKTFHELCGSCFCKEIGRRILGKQGDEVMRNIFDVGWESEGMFFWWWRIVKLLDFLKTEKCVLDLDFGCGK